MITGLIASMQAINLSHDSIAKIYANNQASLAMANSVTGNETPDQLVSLAQMDKAFALENARAQTNYLVSQAMQESAAKLQEKDRELKKSLMQSGAIFV